MSSILYAQARKLNDRLLVFDAELFDLAPFVYAVAEKIKL